MSRKFILSWRSFTTLVFATGDVTRTWVDRQVAAGSLHISRYTALKAISYIQLDRNMDLPDAFTIVQSYVRRFFTPEAIADTSAVTARLYTRIASRAGFDDLEIFAICFAIENSYEYVCDSIAEAEFARSLNGELLTTILPELINETRSSKFDR